MPGSCGFFAKRDLGVGGAFERGTTTTLMPTLTARVALRPTNKTTHRRKRSKLLRKPVKESRRPASEVYNGASVERTIRTKKQSVILVIQNQFCKYRDFRSLKQNSLYPCRLQCSTCQISD